MSEELNLDELGSENNQSYESDGLVDGELVDIIILDTGFSKKYLDDIEGQNKILKEKSEALMETFVPKEPTVKEGGMAINYAIIYRSRSEPEPYEKVFVDDGIMFFEPTFNAFGTFFIQDLPRLYSSWVRGGDSKKSKDGPGIINYLPSPMVEKDWKTGVSADKIPEGKEDFYLDLIQREKNRIQKWETYNEKWKKMGEEACKNFLLGLVSKVLLICEEEDGKYVYKIPELGMTLRMGAKARGAKGYINLVAFDWVNNGEDKKKLVYYSNLDVKYPSDDMIQYANTLIEYRTELFQQKVDKKRQQKLEDNTPPF